MPYFLPVPANLVTWKITIHDKERLEEDPHVNVIKGECKWRINLKTGQFMDPQKPGCTLHKQVRKIINANWDLLIEQWNKMYPNNTVDVADDQAEEETDAN